MVSVVTTKQGPVVTGIKVDTQFDLESSEKLFMITGPKVLSWTYKVAGGPNAPSPDVVAEHIDNVRRYVHGKWRSKFKDAVKKECVKQIKPLEKLYKAKGAAARQSEKDGFAKIASNKAESIILATFEAFVEEASAASIKGLGKKAGKIRRSAGKIVIGGAVVSVGVVTIVSTAGAASIPVMAGVGMALTALSAGGTAIKTYLAARKEFRDAQKKLAKSKGTAMTAIEAMLKDAKHHKLKWHKMILRMNELGVQIEKLDRELAGLRVPGADPERKKVVEKALKKAKGLRDTMTRDLEKMEAIVTEDPQVIIDVIEKIAKSLRQDVPIEERISAHDRGDRLFGGAGEAGNLGLAVAAL